MLHTASSPEPPAPGQFTFPTNLNLAGETGEGFHQDLLRGLTHKLNNLLAVVQGFSSLILMSEDTDPGGLENVGHIREASVSMSSLSERIRSAGGCARITLQPLNVSDYVSVVGTAIHDPFVKTGVPFELDVQPGLPSVLVDPMKFKEVLIELLKNAAEAAGHGSGRATMRVCGPGVITPAAERRVDILVSNTGSLVPPEKLLEVFRPFSGTKNSSHLGLGLTIAAMLAHQMNLQLGIHSENFTTTFWLSCPTTV